MLAQQIAKLLLEIKAVNLNIKKPFRFTSGILSPIYCDNRLIISFPQHRQTIINAFLEVIQQKAINFDVAAGTATAGIPHAAWIADRLDKPMVYVRSKAKEHGKKNQVEGLLLPKQNALVVEDLISTGDSAINAALALREAGAEVTDCLAIFTYEMQSAQQNFAKANVKLHTLTQFSTLMDVAFNEGYVNAEEKKIALEWNKNPQSWQGLVVE